MFLNNSPNSRFVSAGPSFGFLGSPAYTRPPILSRFPAAAAAAAAAA